MKILQKLVIVCLAISLLHGIQCDDSLVNFGSEVAQPKKKQSKVYKEAKVSKKKYGVVCKNGVCKEVENDSEEVEEVCIDGVCTVKRREGEDKKKEVEMKGVVVKEEEKPQLDIEKMVNSLKESFQGETGNFFNLNNRFFGDFGGDDFGLDSMIKNLNQRLHDMSLFEGPFLSREKTSAQSSSENNKTHLSLPLRGRVIQSSTSKEVDGAVITATTKLAHFKHKTIDDSNAKSEKVELLLGKVSDENEKVKTIVRMFKEHQEGGEQSVEKLESTDGLSEEQVHQRLLQIFSAFPDLRKRFPSLYRKAKNNEPLPNTVFVQDQAS